jgi:NAD(P)-dependent dehydrogenase (short-subunit alcohol dehydrogenase family)
MSPSATLVTATAPSAWFGRSKRRVGRAIAVQADLSNPADVDAMITKLVAAFGPREAIGSMIAGHTTGKTVFTR